ncbi:kinase-like domain-containing protein [Pelagophyceae sp. CCMP2097]|nr:kinase-like domain-containing protein [Pelagophyceae sp. CCMP2097]
MASWPFDFNRNVDGRLHLDKPPVQRLKTRPHQNTAWLHRATDDDPVESVVEPWAPGADPTVKAVVKAGVTGAKESSAAATVSTPRGDAQNAALVVLEHWKLESKCSALPSYDDENWLVETDGTKYVLKVAQAGADCRGGADAEATRSQLDCENRIMSTLHSADLIVPQLIYPGIVALGDGQFARLISFVQGETLSDTLKASTEPMDLLSNYGASLGRVDRALEAFDDDGVCAGRVLGWDLRNAGNARKYLQDVDDAGKRDLAKAALDAFDASIADIDALPKQVLHGDANDQNVLVEDGKVAFLDFGDFIKRPRVFEVAIALAYALFGSADGADALKRACVFVDAYHGEHPLLKTEVKLLWVLIAARNAQTVLTAAHTQKLRPNDAYVTTSAEPAWVLLRQLAEVEVLVAEKALVQAVKPHPEGIFCAPIAAVSVALASVAAFFFLSKKRK